MNKRIAHLVAGVATVAAQRDVSASFFAFAASFTGFQGDYCPIGSSACNGSKEEVEGSWSGGLPDLKTFSDASYHRRAVTQPDTDQDEVRAEAGGRGREQALTTTPWASSCRVNTNWRTSCALR